MEPEPLSQHPLAQHHHGGDPQSSEAPAQRPSQADGAWGPGLQRQGQGWSELRGPFILTWSFLGDKAWLAEHWAVRAGGQRAPGGRPPAKGQVRTASCGAQGARGACGQPLGGLQFYSVKNSFQKFPSSSADISKDSESINPSAGIVLGENGHC